MAPYLLLPFLTVPNVIKILLSGYYDNDDGVWRWGTGEILPSNAPQWGPGEPTHGTPPRVIVITPNFDGFGDITDGRDDFKAICEAGNNAQQALLFSNFKRVCIDPGYLDLKQYAVYGI